MAKFTEYLLSQSNEMFGENLKVKHNQRQSRAFYQLAREGFKVELIRHDSGKKFVKCFKINEPLIRRIIHAKNKQNRINPKDY